MPHISRDFALTLEAIIDTAIDGIITIDASGIVERMNPAAADLFEYKPSEVIGRNIKMLMPSPYKAEHDHYIQRYQETKVPHIIGTGREVRGLTKQGKEFPFRLAVSEVILNDRVIYTGIIHDLSSVHEANAKIVELNKVLEQKVVKRTYELEDTVNRLLSTNKTLEREVTERKLAEQKLQSSEQELIQALEKEKELNELKSRFVSMASHEFRTPLTSVLSSAALIGRYTTESQQPNREKHIERIKASVANLTGILNDFLSLSKLEEGKFEVNLTELNVSDLCAVIIEDTKSLLKSDQKIHHSIHGEARPLRVDERVLKNILFNLISNAIKYSDGVIECGFYFEDDHCLIKISDKGIGIPEADQKYLFSRFFRAGNATNIQGTGLGLHIVKRYVDMLDGDISFVSEQEVGTTFTVKIPYK